MTIVLVLAAVLGMLALVVTIVVVSTRHRAPSVSDFGDAARFKIVDRHERERVGKDE